VNYTP